MYVKESIVSPCTQIDLVEVHDFVKALRGSKLLKKKRCTAIPKKEVLQCNDFSIKRYINDRWVPLSHQQNQQRNYFEKVKAGILSGMLSGIEVREVFQIQQLF